MAKAKVLDPLDLLEQFRKFFFVNFDGFSETKGYKAQVAFLRTFPEKNLAIRIAVPLASWHGGPMKVVKGRRIRFSVLFEGKECLILKDSVAKEKWQDVTKGKIEALLDLMDDIKPCGRCGVYHYPKQKMDEQVNPKGTHFVQLICPECSRTETTSYRFNRLKSRLNSYLDRSRIMK
ncbi:MAG TPA: hypothetical protein DCX32_04855 [Candidatus Moranbacteria bacterium]|nr:MAG: hypothetical protein UW95_C0021G0001 [Parcubacteria group bacterium GW2011_GWC1_45_14]HAV11836.1 hypothetical protein [Candidatus Moranbacteria bacterium]